MPEPTPKSFKNPMMSRNVKGFLLVVIPVGLALAIFFWVWLVVDHDLKLEAVGTWVGSIAVVVAGSFAAFQVLDARSVALTTSFFQMMSRYQDANLQEARALVLTYGDGETAIDPAAIDDNLKLKTACLSVCRFYELIGTLVRFKGLQFALVNSYLHTRCIFAYRRLRLSIAHQRQRDPEAWRYFEYLALRCIEASDRHDDEYTEYVKLQQSESVSHWQSQSPSAKVAN